MRLERGGLSEVGSSAKSLSFVWDLVLPHAFPRTLHSENRAHFVMLEFGIIYVVFYFCSNETCTVVGKFDPTSFAF